jgi:hypothetical protein
MFKKKQLILQLLPTFFEKLIYDNVADEGKIVAISPVGRNKNTSFGGWHLCCGIIGTYAVE